MRELIVKNFNAVLALSVVIGLFMPWLEYLPKSSAIILISIAIFFSCSKVSIDELRHVNIKAAGLFYIVRFLALPILVYYIANYFVPEYAMGILLVTLAPVGASSTAVASLTRANPATVITNALAPFAMPVLIFALGGSDINISIYDIFITLSLSIFLPAFIYFGIVLRVERMKTWVKNESNFISTLCIGGMMAVVIAMEKNYILGNMGDVFYLVMIGMLLFLVLYMVAWVYTFRMNNRYSRTYMICSGVNNTGLSAGIALLYFSPSTILFVIVAEISWVLGLILFKKYVDKYNE